MTEQETFDERETVNPEYLERDFDEQFTNQSNRTRTISSFVEQYQEPEVNGTETEVLAGRVVRMNDFGQIAFADIRDETGEVQIVFREDDRAGRLTVGDYIEAEGHPTTTDSGEFSLEAQQWSVLTPVSREVPTRTGLSEMEEARDRVGAMLVNDELRESIQTRFNVITSCRQFLTNDGYQEVQTPMLHHGPSGAAAEPFITYVNAINEEMSLRIAPELYLKRLVIGGYENIFEIGRNFRNEDADSSHNPEFTMLELYSAYSNYEDMMELTEELVAHIIEETTGSTTIEYDGNVIDFEPPWDRVEYVTELNEILNVNLLELSDSEVIELAETELNENISSVADAYDELYEEYIEEDLVQPTFVIDHPQELTPLCSTHSDNEQLIERFEAVVSGMEIANSYSELTNPEEQYERFREQMATEEDMQFVDDLSYGMPPTGGLGIGLDRVAMIAAQEQSIRNVLPFPITASKNHENN